MEETAARRAAAALLDEHRKGVSFKPLDPSYRLVSIADAYDIQDRYVALLGAEHGEAIGYKVGLTSKAMQTFCGSTIPSRASFSRAACMNPELPRE
jgi:2-keto-4-pentenoate hydratase